eukprot:TRINITY_DN5972_c0_g1_i2.p2 TRINITY_DN5972_c0_g1~~TRINITY_DN5972_c0_g1_i2.p2  ORF type:complete len:111 (+),score=22.25 TRINITY_DN5972_c0_g1_i2:85-417(+)
MAPMDAVARRNREAEQESLLRNLKAHMVATDREEIEPLRKALEDAKFLACEGPEMEAGELKLRQLEGTHMPLTFTDIAREDMEQLLATSSREAAAAALVKSMGLIKSVGT